MQSLSKRLQKPQNNYYKWDKVFSYNALFHLIITERGLGKTYGLYIKLITGFHYKGHKTILLTKFLNEIDCNLEESYQYSVHKTMLEIQRNNKEIQDLNLNIVLTGRHIYINDEIAFSFYAINEAEKMKKITELKTYSRIVHDECIRFDRYVNNEIDKILTIYDTVDRRKNTTKLFLLGNALTRFNPYIEGFKLDVTGYGYFYDKARRFLVHISNDEAYQEERLNSAITKLAGEDSKYTNMASKGQFVYDNDDFVVESVNEIERTHFALVIGGKEITFSRIRNGYYLHTKTRGQRLFHNKQPSRSSVPIGKERLNKLKAIYLNSILFFENIEIKNNFIKEYMGGAYK